MSLKIRLARGGAKKRPFYKIVVAENTSPRDGKFIERLGSYNPLVEKDSAEHIVANAERIMYWMSVGAQLSPRVQKLISSVGIVGASETPATPKKSAPKKKAQERIKRAEAAAQASAEA